MSRLLVPLSSRRLANSRRSKQFLVDPRPFRPTKLHSVYGDDFDRAAIDPAWSTQGSLPTALQIATPSVAKFAVNATNQYVYRAAPSGDFTVTAQIANTSSTTYFSQMHGLMVLDSSGNGVGLCPYNSPDEWILCSVAAGVYNSSFQQVGALSGAAFMNNSQGLYKIIKSGTSYTAQVGDELAGTWSASSPSVTGPATATRIGVGCWFYNGPRTIRVDWIDVT